MHLEFRRRLEKGSWESSLVKMKGRPSMLPIREPHIRYRIDDRFAVPFEEDDRDPKTWFLDLDYIESMWEMFRKVNG
jgi:hypothetical protein